MDLDDVEAVAAGRQDVGVRGVVDADAGGGGGQALDAGQAEQGLGGGLGVLELAGGVQDVALKKKPGFIGGV